MKREQTGSKHPRSLKGPRPGEHVTRPAAGAVPRQGILDLHQAVGNRAMQRLLQARLAVSHPDDALEREADHVAREVMHMPEPRGRGETAGSLPPSAPCCPDTGPAQPRTSGRADQQDNPLEGFEEERLAEPTALARELAAASGEDDPDEGFAVQVSRASSEVSRGMLIEEEGSELPAEVAADAETPHPATRAEAEDESEVPLQTKRSGEDGARSIEARLSVSARGGDPIGESDRGFFEARFGYDFEQVRIHTDSEARALSRDLNARAFTTGRDIYFAQGEYDPRSSSGKELLAHELTHVVQQAGGSGASITGAGLVQRKDGKKNTGGDYYEHQVFVPQSYTTLDQMYRLFERTAYGRETNSTWSCGSYCDMSKNRGKSIQFLASKSRVEAETDPAAKERREKHKSEYGEAPPGRKKQEITDEVDRRYNAASGNKPGTKIKPGQEGRARQWEQSLDEVLKDKESLQALPDAIKSLCGGEASFKPKDYQQLLRIAGKVRQFGPEDFAVYKLLSIRATDNLDVFEKSVDMYLARKAELRKALEQQQEAGGPKEKTLDDALAEKWKGLDEAGVGKMSEADRYDLARQKTSELTEAQLKYMKEHPGETLKDFVKGATLVNTPETFGAIQKDLIEASSGDANSWARWAAGTGAGAKLSGWLLAVAGIVYVASWLTGIGELATIAAAAGYLLAATLTLSLAESELRIKAASQAKTPEEFKRNVQLAAAARSNVAVGLALIVVAAVLHFTAKAFFPKTIANIKLSLKNLRERIRLKGSVYDLKPGIVKELGTQKAELAKVAESAKQNAHAAATELDGLSTEQFVDRLEKGDGGFMDQSKLPPEQKVNFRDLLKTPEGRSAIEAYQRKLVQALKTDVVAEIDRLANEYGSRIDEFLKDVEAARNHDDLSAASDRLEKALSEERAKAFMQGEQDTITQRKLEEAAGEAHQEVLAAVREAIVRRAKSRIAAQSDKFSLKYTDGELDAIVKKGKELGLSDRVIEDLIYTGSRTAKAVSALDLMQQMDNWANVVSSRGFPFRFADLAEFQQFSRDLLDSVQSAGLPADDVRIQGSSLRKPGANDVDLAVFVDEAKFDKILIDRYNERITLKTGEKISLAGKSHAELARLAEDIAAAPDRYNAQASTFQNAMKNAIISSKSDILKPLKAAAAAIAAKYPGLNIEAISILIRGGAFDIKPDLPVSR